MVTTILKVIGGALALLGLAWLHGAYEQQTYRQRKEELDELSHAHFGKPFDELDGPEERGAILMLYGEVHDDTGNRSSLIKRQRIASRAGWMTLL